MPEAKASMEPLVVDTIAMFDATTPSKAFSVEVNGRGWPLAHSVRYPSTPWGTTVAFST